MMEKPAREKEQYPTFHPSINYISSLPHPFFVEWLPPSVVSTFTSLSTCGCFSKVRRYFAAIKTITGHKTFSSTGVWFTKLAQNNKDRECVLPHSLPILPQDRFEFSIPYCSPPPATYTPAAMLFIWSEMAWLLGMSPLCLPAQIVFWWWIRATSDIFCSLCRRGTY